MSVTPVIIALLPFLLCGAASAQIGPGILIKPWDEKPHWAQTFDQPIFLDGGYTKDDNKSIHIFHYESHGRIKLDRENPQPDFTIGYRALTIDISTDHPDLPAGLTDLAVVGAGKVGEVEGGWKVSLLGGMGTANDNHFDNGDAIYGIAALHFMRQLGPTRELHAGLSYNGNRTFLHDVPLPYVTFQDRVSPELMYTVGLPTSSIFWKPCDPLTIQATYTLPVNISGSVTYSFAQGVGVFAEFDRVQDGFHLKDQDNRRLFYELSRISAGVQFAVEPLGDIKIGGGYAFSQEFATGFDVRNTDTVAKPGDELFFFFTVQGKF